MVSKWRGLARLMPWSMASALFFWSPTIQAEAVTGALPNQPAANAAYGPPAPPPAAARTRVMIGLDREAFFRFSYSTFPGNSVIVEIESERPRLPDQTGGIVKSFRSGVSAPGVSRVVIEVSVPVVVENAKIQRGADGKAHNLVFEFAPVSQEAFAKRAAQPRPSALGGTGLSSAGAVQAPEPKLAVRPSRPVIVLDPGHGGHDSGAMKNGAVEKDVVLAFAKRLREKLQATGLYKVVLTRDTDIFVELGERVAFADRQGASLFIAVHADYAGGNSQARGATIYSLRESVAKSLKNSAKSDVLGDVLPKEKASMVQKASQASGALDVMDTVKSWLAELAEREVEATKDRTSIFSRSVTKTMAAGTDINMRNDPEQQASFRVLKTAKFPSVLIELAYVTNKDDAENLKSDVWRDKVADKIVAAIGECGCLNAIPRKQIETAESAANE